MIHEIIFRRVQAELSRIAPILRFIYELLFVLNADAYGKGLLFKKYMPCMEHIIGIARTVTDAENDEVRCQPVAVIYDDFPNGPALIENNIRKAAVKTDGTAEPFNFKTQSLYDRPQYIRTDMGIIHVQNLRRRTRFNQLF